MPDIEPVRPGSPFAIDKLQPPTITELLSRLNAPIPSLGYRMHYDFSAVGLRGIETHRGVIASRRPDHPQSGVKHDSEFRGLPTSTADYVILTPLTPRELTDSGDILKLFLNDIGITSQTPEIQGVVILEDYDLKLDESPLSFSVGVVRDRDLMRAGEPGLMFRFYQGSGRRARRRRTEVSLSVLPNPKSLSGGYGYLSESHRRAHEVVQIVQNEGKTFINQAAIQAVDLVRVAIIDREIKGERIPK